MVHDLPDRLAVDFDDENVVANPRRAVRPAPPG